MKITSKTLLAIFAFALASLCPLGPDATAQQADNPVYYPVTFSGTLTRFGTEAELYFGLYDEEGNDVSVFIALQEPDNTDTDGPKTAYLYPNKTYIVSYDGIGGTAVVDLQPVPGAALMIDGVETTRVQLVGSDTYELRVGVAHDYALETQPPDLRAGASSSIVSDKPIWYLGLGKMRNGKPAGAIGFREADFSDSGFFTPSILFYDSPDPLEVERLPATGTIEQVYSPEVLINVEASTSNSYTMEVYARDDVESTKQGDGRWHPQSGHSPFAVYTISELTVSGGAGVEITKVEDSVTWETSLELSSTTWTHRDWRKTTADAENKVTTYYSTSTSATVTHRGEKADDSGYEDALVWTKTFTTPASLKELDTRTFGASEDAPVVHDYDYYTSTGSGGIKGEIKSLIRPDESWVLYEYYDSGGTSGGKGMVKRIYRPWESGPSTPTASTSQCTYEDWTYEQAIDDSYRLPDARKLYAPNGTLISHTEWDYDDDIQTDWNGHTIAEWVRKDFWGSGTDDRVATTMRYHREDDDDAYFQEQPVSVLHPDGQKDSYAYLNGTWTESSRSFAPSTSGDDRLVLIFHGRNSGGTSVTRWPASGTPYWDMDTVYMVTGSGTSRSTVTEIITDKRGRVVLSAENVYYDGTLVRISGTMSRFDTNGRLTAVVDLARSVGTSSGGEYKSTRTYANGGLLEDETGFDGTVTKYEYNDLLRLTTKTIGHGGSGSYPAQVQQFTYDGAGRPVTAYDCSCGTASIVTSYDSAGRISGKAEASPNGSPSLITLYRYPTKQKRETQHPSEAEDVEETFLDGRPKSISGDSQAPVYYDYGYNSTGLLVTRTNGTAADSRWVEEQFDRLGRLKKRTRPSPGWSTGNPNKKIEEEFFYNSAGQLEKITTKDVATSNYIVADRRFEYDGDGNLIKEGLDTSSTAGLQDTSSDRITAYDTWLQSDASGWLRYSTFKAAPETSGGLTLTASEVRTRLTGFNGNAQPATGQWVTADVIELDANGRWTVRWDFAEPGVRSRWSYTWTQGVDNGDYRSWTNGYLDSTTSLSGVDHVYEYDSAGRLVKDKSRWDGSAYKDLTTYAYHGSTDYVDTVTYGGLVTSYEYAWGSPSGTRQVSVTLPGSRTTHTLYDGMSLPANVWGNGAQPVAYAYDAMGRRTGQTTYRTGSFTGDDWPTSPPTGATTTWDYEEVTGLLTTKTYADSTATTYTYTALGQPYERTLDTGKKVTYRYYDGSTTSAGDVSHKTQELRQIDYSDGSTTDSGFTYKRSGLPYQITDVTGTRTYTYRSDLQLNYETLDSSFFGSNRTVTPTYDSLGRGTGVEFKTSSTVESATAFTLDTTTGRISTVTGKSGTPTITYTYLADTDWVSSLTNGGYYVRTNTLDTARMILDKAETTWNGSSKGTYDSTFDTAGRRSTQVQSGSIPYSGTTTYTYNDRDEVTGSSSNTHTFKSWYWTYDLMGKRDTAYNSLIGNIDYTWDSESVDVNQYASITSQSGLAYDDDGNMTQDGTWYFRYDGANRLKEMERKSDAYTLQFLYDFAGRRVQKIVRTGGPTGTVTGSTKYVWDGWKLIAELDSGTSTTGSTWVRGFVWGLDFSNAAGPAGGAGGLIAVNTSSATYFPVYDSMGNITGYLDSSNGNVVAGCEYNAFGQIVVSSGTWTTFGFGFATQYTDRESGFVYYGHRYYDTWQGRFINRDPIEEAGGTDLYGFVGSNPANSWDVLGLCFGLPYYIRSAGDDAFGGIFGPGYGGEYNFGFGLTFSLGLGYDSCWEQYEWYFGGGGGFIGRPERPVPGPVLDSVRAMLRLGAFAGDGLVPAGSSDNRWEMRRSPFNVVYRYDPDDPKRRGPFSKSESQPKRDTWRGLREVWEGTFTDNPSIGPEGGDIRDGSIDWAIFIVALKVSWAHLFPPPQPVEPSTSFADSTCVLAKQFDFSGSTLCVYLCPDPDGGAGTKSYIEFHARGVQCSDTKDFSDIDGISEDDFRRDFGSEQ